MLLKLFILTQAISLAFSSSSLRLKEIENLIDKFNSELDINYLFYDKVREQKGNPLLCSSELGPYCNIINGQSLLDKVDYTNDTLDIQMRKAAIVRDWDQIHLQEQSTGAFYVVSNKHDVNLGREKKATLPDKVDALMTFEQLPTSPKETLISDALLYKYNLGFQLDTTGMSGKFPKDSDLKISFEKLYVPEESQVYNKKSLHDAQEVANKKETEIKNIEPTELYVYTKKNEEGVLHFSRPIVIQQIYARKHNFLQYENERKAEGKSTRAEYTFIGRYIGNNAVEFNGNAFSNVNKWTRVIPKVQNIAIDSLVITANTDIDNILFTIAKSEVHKTGLTAEDLQDISQFLSSRLTHYQSFKDPKDMKKIMKQDIEAHLKEKNFDKELIGKMVDGIEIIDIGGGHYNIMIGDATDLLDLPAGMEVLQMNELLGNNPEQLEELKAQLLKEFEKKGLTDEDVIKEVNALFSSDTVTASSKQGDEKKKGDVGESKIKKN